LVAASLSLAAFIAFDSECVRLGGSNSMDLAALVVLNAIYVLLSAYALTTSHGDTSSILTLQIAYWVGFSIGGTSLLRKETRYGFIYNRRRLRKFAFIIFIAELCGMFVYFFEFLGVSAADPSLVSLIIGGHVTVVFFASVLLSRTRRRMGLRGCRRMWLLGVRIKRDRLPEKALSIGSFIRFFMVQATLLAALFAAGPLDGP
jgi:hypothetical protein